LDSHWLNLMLLHSKKTIQHSRKRCIETRHNYDSLLFGDIGLYSIDGSRVNSRQLEAIRVQIKDQVKKQARIFVNLCPQLLLTKKPEETRMGKGKGNVKYRSSIVRPGSNILELRGNISKLKVASIVKKLPMRSMLLNKRTRWIF